MESEKVNKKYSYEDILEMLGGIEYFSEEQAKYVFHKMNGDLEEAQYYLNICLHEAEKIKKCSSKLKTQEEIDLINNTQKEISTDV